MADVLCGVCGAKTDAFICKGCSDEIRAALDVLPSLLEELDVTVSRQDRGTGVALYAMRRSRLQLPGVHYDEGSTTLPCTPWPFSWDAADLVFAVENTLTGWCRHLLERAGVVEAGVRRLVIHRNRARWVTEYPPLPKLERISSDV